MGQQGAWSRSLFTGAGLLRDQVCLVWTCLPPPSLFDVFTCPGPAPRTNPLLEPEGVVWGPGLGRLRVRFCISLKDQLLVTSVNCPPSFLQEL